MKQIAQNYKTGSVLLQDTSAPVLGYSLSSIVAKGKDG